MPEDDSNVRKIMARFEAVGARAAALPSRMPQGTKQAYSKRTVVPLVECSVGELSFVFCFRVISRFSEGPRGRGAHAFRNAHPRYQAPVDAQHAFQVSSP